MIKPLFRWTCGSVTDQGLDILSESVRRILYLLPWDRWDFMICHNGFNDHEITKIQTIVQNRPIEIIQQDWSSCPILDDPASPKRNDGTIEIDGAVCGGTLWKVCPARMRINAHEIVMDNDIVLLEEPPQFDEFLSSQKTMVLEEPIRFFGRYDYLISPGDKLNSGLMGMPPGYDFGLSIKEAWELNGMLQGLTQADEQGLLMYVLSSHPCIRIKKTQILERGAGEQPNLYGDEIGFHFVQANRTMFHRSWFRYKEMFLESIPYL